MGNRDETVEGLVNRLDEASQECEGSGDSKVTIGKLLDAVGHRSYGPFLLVPALIELSPIGGIPGVPTFLAAIILVAAVQMVLGQPHLWTPDWLEKREIPAEKVDKGVDVLRGPASWMDKISRERLEFLISDVSVRIAAAIVVALCLTVPPLELLPFASGIPLSTIALFGFAITVRDGLMMLLAFIASVAAAAGMIWIAI